MAVIGRFAYDNGEPTGKIIIMDIGSNTNFTRVDLDFGSDEQTFQKAKQTLSRIEKVVKEKLPFHPTAFMPVTGTGLNAIFLRGRSFNGDLLPQRQMVDLENVQAIVQQIREFDSNIKPEALDVYRTL